MPPPMVTPKKSHRKGNGGHPGTYDREHCEGGPHRKGVTYIITRQKASQILSCLAHGPHAGTSKLKTRTTKLKTSH